MTADYREASVETCDAVTVVENARTFLSAIERFLDGRTEPAAKREG